jgi:hypothetical protein
MFQGGFASYWRMAKAAKDGSLPREGSTDFENLKNACAEAIVYKNYREAPSRGQAPLTSQTVFDPVGKAKIFTQLLSDPFTSIGNKILDVIGNKTPDALHISAPNSYRTAAGIVTDSPGLTSIVDPNDLTASRTIDEPYKNQTVISPIEITTSQSYSYMKGKVDKARTYKNPFPNAGSVIVVPLVIFDRAAFLSQSLKDRLRIVDLMARKGGRIQLVTNLTTDATLTAKSIAPELVQAVAAVQRTKSKEPDSKDIAVPRRI